MAPPDPSKSSSNSDLLKSTSAYSIEFNPERTKLGKDIARQEKKAVHVLRRAAFSSSDKLIDRDILKEVINESQQRWLGCLMLPVTLLFFTFYSIAASLHEDVANSHLLEAPIRAKFTPALEEDEEATTDMLQGVTTVPDVYTFIENTYLPLMFKQTDDLNNALPRDDWSKLYQYNKVQGLVILELQRSTKMKCTDEIAAHLSCYPQDEFANENFGLPFADMPNTQSYYLDGADPIINCANEGFSVLACDESRRLSMLRDDLEAKVPPSAPSEGYTYHFTFDPNTTYTTIQQRFQYLKDRGFLDDQSTKLTMKAYYLNYQMEVPRLQAVVINFHFSRGGGVFSRIAFMGIALQTFIGSASLVFDCLFTIMLVLSTLFLIRDFCKALISRNARAHFSFVNFVTWLSVFVGWLNALALVASSGWRNSIIDDIATYMATPTMANAIKFADNADGVGTLMGFMRISIADAHILFMIRCFISLKWQPRLEVVTRTISVMASDLMHFLIVLIPTFVAFAIAGMMMFGRRLQDFSTLQASLATCFKIAMESEFKWNEMSAQDFMTSACWAIPFMILVVLLMLNMVLAIIMDIYQEVRREAGNRMTITQHIRYIFNFFSQRGTWIPYNTLYTTVDNMPQTVSILELRQAFPSMPDYQGAYLVKECFNKAKKMARVGVDPSVIEQMVAAIHVSLEEVLKDVNDMKSRGWMGMGFEIANAGERETVKDILTSVSTQQHWMSLTQKNMNVLQARVDGLIEEEVPEKLEKPEKKETIA